MTADYTDYSKLEDCHVTNFTNEYEFSAMLLRGLAKQCNWMIGGYNSDRRLGE